MYITMAFIGCIIFPYAVISKGITLKNPPFRIVVVGTIYAVCGALLAIGMGSVCGVDMSGELQAQQFVKNITANDSLMTQLGLDKVSEEEQASRLSAYYKSTFELLPSVFFIFGAVVSYLEYILIYRRKTRKGQEAIPMTPIGEFNLDKNMVLGWAVLVLIAYMLTTGDMKYGHIMAVNIVALSAYVFALQGISLIFEFSRIKGVKKIFPVILVAGVFLMGRGIYIFLILGLFDLIFKLKKRIKSR